MYASDVKSSRSCPWTCIGPTQLGSWPARRVRLRATHSKSRRAEAGNEITKSSVYRKVTLYDDRDAPSSPRPDEGMRLGMSLCARLRAAGSAVTRHDSRSRCKTASTCSNMVLRSALAICLDWLAFDAVKRKTRLGYRAQVASASRAAWTARPARTEFRSGGSLFRSDCLFLPPFTVICCTACQLTTSIALCISSWSASSGSSPPS